jgi:DNA-binding NarL/FixJ family response regulator
MKSSEKSSTAPGTTSDRSLNDREVAILRLLAEGYTSSRIASELSLSTETIRWYRKKLLLKFDADNAVALVRKATDNGII